MITKEDKLFVLSMIASKCNQVGITWAIGASLLLYFKGYVDDFHDIDLMVKESDAIKMRNLLATMGNMLPKNYDVNKYGTKYFYEFVIDGVDVDMLGGFSIINDGILYDCDLKESEISGYIDVYNQRVPLHSVALWRRYYELMGREKKVKIIDEKGV